MSHSFYLKTTFLSSFKQNNNKNEKKKKLKCLLGVMIAVARWKVKINQ
jgi:hypothetical protein